MANHEALVMQALVLLLGDKFGTKETRKMNSHQHRHWQYEQANEAAELVEKLKEAINDEH
jgi:hypothetical protein